MPLLTIRSAARVVTEHLGVPANRIFLNFTYFPRTRWGFNGSTLA